MAFRNLEVARKYNREWRKKNPGSWRPGNRAYRRTLRGKYGHLLDTARTRDIEVTLSFEEYCKIVCQPCFYCGNFLPEAGYGVDRIMSTVGYVRGNIRPCCTKCNYAKRKMTEGEFREWAIRLFNHWAGV